MIFQIAFYIGWDLEKCRISLIDSVYMDKYNFKVIFDYIGYGKYGRDSTFYFIECGHV